ncbi:SWIM zinc finger family protein [Methylosinus sp. LW4]|uniref:SWIM zinc finger family protein n=1 Tax=Methylosinus sp. LW4 TaxID=136993 RepID=UPI0005BC1A18|nr:SWIM zinc finger family protein [Methylosinus sp. LW4]
MSAAIIAAHARLDATALADLASPGLVRRAEADIAEGKVAIAEASDAAVRVTADGETVTLVALGVERSSCTCRSPRLCRHRIAAALLIRSLAPVDAAPTTLAPIVGRSRRKSAPDASKPELPRGVSTAVETRRALLADATALAERVFAIGFSRASASLDADLAALSTVARAVGEALLAARLQMIAGHLEAGRNRDPTYSATALLCDLAATAAHAAALGASSVAGPADAEACVAGLRLIGLGARLWENDSARGVTAVFYSPSERRILHATHARRVGMDPMFAAATAYRIAATWGATFGRLTGCDFILRNAEVDDVGRIAVASAARVDEARPWRPSRSVVSAWPVAFDDWRVLQDHCRLALGGRLMRPGAARTYLVIMPKAIHAIEFDELRQRSYWPASDRHGRFVALEAPADRRPDGELDGRLTGRADPLVVEATVEDGAIRLLPLSLLGATITTLDFIDSEQSGRRIGMVERAKGLLVRRKTRIRRFSLSPLSRAGRRAPADALLRIAAFAESAGNISTERRLETATRLAASLRREGFYAAADVMDRVASAEASDAHGLWLRAAYACATLRRADLELAWAEPAL